MKSESRVTGRPSSKIEIIAVKNKKNEFEPKKRTKKYKRNNHTINSTHRGCRATRSRGKVHFDISNFSSMLNLQITQILILPTLSLANCLIRSIGQSLYIRARYTDQISLWATVRSLVIFKNPATPIGESYRSDQGHCFAWTRVSSG